MSEYQNFIGQLEEINKSAVVDIWVPSAKRKVKFKPMNALQQQNLISFIIGDGVKSNTIEALNCVNKILLENCIEEVELYVIDREAIILQYRLNDSEIEAAEKKNITSGIDYIKKQKEPTQSHIECNGIRAHFTIPTIKRDIAVNSYFSQSDVSDIAQMYNLQIIKYTEEIEIVNTGTKVNFQQNKCGDLIPIIQHLPVTINNKALIHAKNIHEKYMKLTTKPL